MRPITTIGHVLGWVPGLLFILLARLFDGLAWVCGQTDWRVTRARARLEGAHRAIAEARTDVNTLTERLGTVRGDKNRYRGELNNLTQRFERLAQAEDRWRHLDMAAQTGGVNVQAFISIAAAHLMAGEVVEAFASLVDASDVQGKLIAHSTMTLEDYTEDVRPLKVEAGPLHAPRPAGVSRMAFRRRTLIRDLNKLELVWILRVWWGHTAGDDGLEGLSISELADKVEQAQTNALLLNPDH